MAKLLSYKLVGEGNKLARVHKVELTRSNPKPDGTGNLRMVKGQLKVTEGVDEGETLFFQAMLEGKGAYFGGLTLSAIEPEVDWANGDFPEDEEGNLDEAATQEFLTETLVDRDVIAQVKHEQYNGKTQARVTLLPANSDVQLS